jgi:hypothetical protein
LLENLHIVAGMTSAGKWHPHAHMKTNQGLKPKKEEIALAAFHLYVERGGHDGHDLDDWLRAEELLTRGLAEERDTQNLAVPAPPLSSIPPENSNPSPRPSPDSRAGRRSATRGEIRQQTTPLRPASRQRAQA